MCSVSYLHFLSYRFKFADVNVGSILPTSSEAKKSAAVVDPRITITCPAEKNSAYRSRRHPR